MSSTTARVSILMPVKDAEAFLPQCLESILAQSESNWELLAIDDHSSDASHQILAHHAQKDHRIRVFRNNGKGIIDALGLAFSMSSGNLITRMDADDKMLPNKLEVLATNLVNKGMGHIALGQVKYFSDSELKDGYLKYENWLNELTRNGQNYRDIYKECVIPSPCWMVYRDDLLKCEAFTPNTYPEDYDLCFRFYRENLNVIPCDEVLHLWRDHPERSSRTDENYADNRFLELKLNWFLKLDHDPTRTLLIWGAGSKGKRMAQMLTDQQVPFRWVCNNPNKIGKHIYGVEMESVDVVSNSNNNQVIVLVANPDEQLEIRNQLRTDTFWFC